MARVLFVGQQPETVDFTNPVLLPGMNACYPCRITLALKQMAVSRSGTRTIGCFGPMKQPDPTWREFEGSNLRLCGDRRWYSPATP